MRVAPVLLACSLGGCVPSRVNPSLCELTQKRETYAGRAVTVEGFLLVSHHGSAIVDPKCRGGIGVSWFEEDVPWMREFDAVAERSQAEAMMARVRVTGIVKRRSKPDWVGLRPWYLDLAKAEVLRANPISDVDMDRFLDSLTSSENSAKPSP